MMNKSRKLLLLTALSGALGLGLYANSSHATDIDVDASLVAGVAVSLTKNADMDFGGVDFVTGAHNGNLELGTDDAVVLSGGPTGLTLTGTPASGSVTINSATGTVDVSCEATGAVGDGTRTMPLSSIKWDTAATTFALATNTCGGLGVGAVAVNTTATPNPILLIGAQLDVAANALDGSVGGTPYDTSTGGGDPVTFRVVFQ